MMIGYNAGLNVELPVAKDFYLQPGLLFSTKGSKETGGAIDTKLSIGYIELPINFLYKPLLGSGHFMFGFGPYVGYGITGKAKITAGGVTVSEDVKFKNNLSVADMLQAFYYLKALDAGANILAGYEFAGRLSFQMNAQLGLVKINPSYVGDTGDKTVLKNTGFGFSLGYRF